MIKKISLFVCFLISTGCATISPEKEPEKLIHKCRDFALMVERNKKSFTIFEDQIPELPDVGKARGIFTRYTKGSRLMLLDITVLGDFGSMDYNFYFLKKGLIYCEMEFLLYNPDEKSDPLQENMIYFENALYAIIDQKLVLQEERTLKDFEKFLNIFMTRES